MTPGGGADMEEDALAKEGPCLKEESHDRTRIELEGAITYISYPSP